MASSSTSIARTRSLRKPTVGTSTDLSIETSTAASSAGTAKERNISPSRLPALKPSARTVSSAVTNQSDVQRAPAPTSSAGTSSTFLRKGRPVSGAGHGRSGSVSSRSQHAQASKAKAQEGEGGQGQQQQHHHPTTRSRYPPSASVSGGFGASAAVKRPTSSSGLPPQSKTRSGLQGPPTAGGPSNSGRTLGRARAKSTTTATTTASRERGVLSDAPFLRPPSQPASSSSSSGVAPKTRPTSTSVRPPSANEGPNPSTSKNIVAHAASTTTTSKSIARSSPSEAVAPSNSISQAAPRLSRKPAFTTHQQHFSPLRRQGPKPPTASYLAPPSPSKAAANVAASAETVRLQTELLQLHLLHRDAAASDAAWRASAKQKLGQRQADLARRDEEVRNAEREAEERENVDALRAWGDEECRARSGGTGLEEKVQVLDAVVTGLWGIEGPGGRYARVVRRFERWCDGFVEVEAARREAENHSERIHGRSGQLEALLRAGLREEDIFVGGLDGAWKDEVAGFARRLEAWARQLRSLGDFSPALGESGPDGAAVEQSSLGRILRSCDILIRDKLAELDVMEGIERAAVERERRWIREMIRGDEDETEDEDAGRGNHDTPRAGAIWRVV